jgi:hypothetical protein
MTHVYSYGLCNIAATAAQDGSQGLFFERDSFPVKQVHVRPKYGAASLLITDQKSWVENLREHRAPLLKRGWVFQEQMLSPRTLHFYKEQIFWYCREQRFSETIPQGDPGITYAMPWLRDELKSYVLPLFGIAHDNSREEFLEAWQRCVEVYSEASLTYETDKLVAISAISRAMQSVIGDRYVAGIWQRELSYQLFWKVKMPGKTRPRSTWHQVGHGHL